MEEGGGRSEGCCPKTAGRRRLSQRRHGHSLLELEQALCIIPGKNIQSDALRRAAAARTSHTESERTISLCA